MKLLRPLLTQPILALSLTLNLLLGVVVLDSWGNTTRNARPVEVVTAAKTRIIQAPPAAKAKAATPFRWSQLETPDFATYVKNLRGIGCPEATIRDIVGGELTEIYSQKRREAGSQSQGKLLEAEMMKLQTEQDHLLTKLTAPAAVEALPGGAVPAMAAAQTPAATTPAASAGISAASPVADIPVAFTYGSKPADVITQQGSQAVLNGQDSSAGLNPAVAKSLTGIKQDFVQSVGDTSNPDSEAYRLRWQQARQHADERFSSMYGGDAFVRAQAQALQQAPAAGATE